MKGPVQSVEVTYFVHATEDPGKLAAAVSDLLQTAAPAVPEDLEGHHGNRILKMRLHLTGEEANEASKALASRLSPSVRRRLLDSIGEHVDEHSALYLRFDKQRLVSGSADFGEGDAVRVKVKPRSFMVNRDARMFYARILEGR